MRKFQYIGTVPIIKNKVCTIIEDRGHINVGSGHVALVNFDYDNLPTHGRKWNISTRHLVEIV